MIENQPLELTLIYHSDKAEDKKARAFIETISTRYTVKILDLKRDYLTEMQLASIADKMNVKIEALYDASYKDRLQSTSNQDITVNDSDLLTVLIQEPILINTPITIIGERAYLYASAYEPLTQNMEEESAPSDRSEFDQRKIDF